jgi:hypothetical protein
METWNLTNLKIEIFTNLCQKRKNDADPSGYCNTDLPFNQGFESGSGLDPDYQYKKKISFFCCNFFHFFGHKNPGSKLYPDRYSA